MPLRPLIAGALSALAALAVSACVTALHVNCERQASGVYVCTQDSIVTGNA